MYAQKFKFQDLSDLWFIQRICIKLIVLQFHHPSHV